MHKKYTGTIYISVNTQASGSARHIPIYPIIFVRTSAPNSLPAISNIPDAIVNSEFPVP
jgi:hypothetical protein